MKRRALALADALPPAACAAPMAPAEGIRLDHDRTLSQIAHGLNWIGGAFLIASAAVIVWAVFRTVGVDDLLVALTVAGLGLGMPAIVAFVVAWILNSLGHAGAESDDEVAAREVAPQRPNLTSLAWAYAVAVLACIAAWGVRVLLDPLLGQQVTYAPLLLSVAFTAWYGGLGPAAFATLLGAGISWYAYLSPRDHFGALDIDDAVQLGLYCAAALCIGGIASALRASRERAQTLAREVLSREAGLERTRGELAAERDRMQITLQSIGDAVIATDAQGNITFSNDCAAHLTGWPAAEAIGKPLVKVFRTLDEHTRRTTTVSLGDAQQDATAGMMLVARDGTERAIESKVSAIRGRSGSPGGFVLVFRDTTQARRARAALEESEARFRVMADQTPVPLWMSDPDRRYVYVNRAWLVFTGRAADDELGDGWTAGIHPEDFGPRQSAFAEAFDARRSFTLEYRLRRDDGEYRWVLDHGASRFDGDGTFAGYIGACLDITERKEAASRLGIFEQRKTAFLTSLAHELRNPLAPIRSSVELLQRMPAAGDPRVVRAQQIIERNCARLAGLVDDLLDLSRIDSGNAPLARESVDVAAVIERAAARHAAPMRDRGQTLALELPRERLRVDGDAARIEQMLAILIGNASSHSSPEGQIAVAARASGDAVAISVCDSGTGIPDEMQPLLFDLFDKASEATANAPQGLGTGLAIVARLARLHGGSVSVDSGGPGKGSRFVVSLPAARPEAATNPATEPSEGAQRAVRLLVVDDNVDAADAIATLLSLNAYEVSTAHDPDEAMELGAAFDPDVILLDIGLPGMTGYELARKLHADRVCRRAKLIAITGYGQPGDTDQAREAGFDGYLVKPVDLEQLHARIDAILGG
ncbi:MAG TPA: PAS domain S-box protein [Casimicrobiaceae bacterium]|nr:PAS domain S-box protein [Casimicrobiaceae bacterium]